MPLSSLLYFFAFELLHPALGALLCFVASPKLRLSWFANFAVLFRVKPEWAGSCSIVKAPLARHYSYPILIKCVDFIFGAKYAFHDLDSDHVFRPEAHRALRTVVIMIPINMELLFAFLAWHRFHTALDFALWAHREPISLPAIFVGLIMLLSIPLCYLAVERTVVFIWVSEYLLFFVLSHFFIVSFLVVSAELCHHHAVNTALIKAFLAFGVIVTPNNDFIDLTVASKTLDARLYGPKQVAWCVGVHLLPFVIDAFQRTLAFLNDLVALDIFKIVLLFKDYLLGVNINFYEFYQVAV